MCSSDLIPVTIDEVAADKAAADQANAAAADMVSALRFIARSGEERLLKLSLVERVEDIDRALFGRSDGRAFVRIDDRLLPVVGEHVTFEEEQVTSLRLRSGDQEICYPVESVLDIVQMPVEPQMRMTRGGLSGVALIGDEHLEVVDPFALFASVPDETITPRTSGRCVIANPDDPWAQEILVPLLRQAGHAIEMGVGAEGDLNEHDVVLCTQLSNGLPKAANLITLRQTPRAQEIGRAHV